MRLRVSVLTVLALGLLSWPLPSSAVAGVGVRNRAATEAGACRTAIATAVAAARPGTPGRAIPRGLQGRATASIQSAIQAGLTEDEAKRQFLGQLRRIRNADWRDDLAGAAAAVVGDAPDECQ